MNHKGLMRWFTFAPGYRSWWKQNNKNYRSAFRNYLDGLFESEDVKNSIGPDTRTIRTHPLPLIVPQALHWATCDTFFSLIAARASRHFDSFAQHFRSSLRRLFSLPHRRTLFGKCPGPLDSIFSPTPTIERGVPLLCRHRPGQTRLIQPTMNCLFRRSDREWRAA